MADFAPHSTALVLIDLQNGIVERSLAPRSGRDVAGKAREFARFCRAAGALVVLIRVSWSQNFADALRQPVDEPMAAPPGGFAEGWDELVGDLAQPGDILITKRQWGAFHGTELDLQLRRRGINTIILGGIATNFGVESTARQGWELGYGVVVAEDLCTSFSADLHAMAIRYIFPRIVRVRQSDEIEFTAA